MGQYATSGTSNVTLNPVLPAAMWPGDGVYVWGTNSVPGTIPAPNDANVQFEAVAVGERSLAVALAPRPGGGSAAGIAVIVQANANPGVMEVDIQNAPIDADGIYLTPSATYKLTVWTGPDADGSYFSIAELQPESDNFVSLKCITNPNGVNLKAKIVYV